MTSRRNALGTLFLPSVLLAFLLVPISSWAETIELVTYYPTSSNAGDLHVRSITVGTAYQNVNMSANDGVALIEDRLGIGTTTPSGSLHVVGPANTADTVLFLPGTGTGIMRVGIGVASPQNWALEVSRDLEVRGSEVPTGGSVASMNFRNTTSGEWWHWTMRSGADGGNLEMHVRPTGVENPANTPLVMTSAGAVGLGTRSPIGGAVRLTVEGDHNAGAGVPSQVVIRGTGANSNRQLLIGFDTLAVGGNYGSIQAVEQGVAYRNLALQRLGGGVGIGTNSPGKILHVLVPGGATEGGMLRLEKTGTSPRRWDFNIKSGSLVIGDDTAGIDRFAITTGGDVGIGIANPIASALHIYGGLDNFSKNGLHVSSANGPTNEYAFFGPNAARNYVRIGYWTGSAFGTVVVGNVNPSTFVPVGDFQVAGAGVASKPGGGAWSASSDVRLKKNVHPMSGALERMLALHGVTFEWKDPASQGNLTGTQMGMIGQEVEKVFPEWVSEDPAGMKVVSVRGFEALTVEAVREMEARNQRLEERVKALEKKLEEVPK